MSQTFLPSFQAKFQRAILHDDCPDGADWERELSGPSKLTGGEGLAIYRQMHRLRMLESMTADFPATKALVGERLFFRLVNDYWREYPSRSYSLDHLGLYFPVFLAMRYGPKTMVAELANFEQILTRIRLENEPAYEPISSAIAQHPIDLLEMVFVKPETTVIETFSFDLPGYYKDFDTGNSVAQDKPQTTIVLFSRPNFQVKYRTLESEEYGFLLNLLVGKSVADSIPSLPLDPHTYLTKVSHWFQHWTADRVLYVAASMP